MGSTGSSVLGSRRDSALVDSLIPFIEQRIKIDEGGCWIWTKRPNAGGYGQAAIGRIHGLDRLHWLAHRLVWRVLVSVDIPAHLHHRCKVPLCVNPDHLEPMTVSAHMIHHHSGRTACSNGHELTERNTYIRKDGRGRQCRRCKADRESARYWKLSKVERHERGLQGSERRRKKARDVRMKV